jgi:Arc/MetJ-type ribon-helix-helix transcriptional regulator
LKYIVDITPDLAKKVSNLVNQGRYESISQFANAAFQNQLLLEESPRETLDNLIETPISESKPSKTETPLSTLAINFKAESIKTVSPPDDAKIPNDCLWGQYNRIFPVKITLRVLANILRDNETIELGFLHSQAVKAAREVGLILRKEDKKSKRKYGDMLSSALPTGRNVTKTEKRFMNHFVGYYTRAGRIEGAPGALKFLNISENEEYKPVVGITQTGLHFAALSNPVLDEADFRTSLSKDESLFYVKTVFQNLDREKELNRSILEKIEKGGSSPSDLNQGINHLSRGWSQAMVNTIRAGAISRLNELGLINRLRNGVNVTYSLTKFGKEILSTLKEKQGGI